MFPGLNIWQSQTDWFQGFCLLICFYMLRSWKLRYGFYSDYNQFVGLFLRQDLSWSHRFKHSSLASQGAETRVWVHKATMPSRRSGVFAVGGELTVQTWKQPLVIFSLKLRDVRCWYFPSWGSPLLETLREMKYRMYRQATKQNGSYVDGMNETNRYLQRNANVFPQFLSMKNQVPYGIWSSS